MGSVAKISAGEAYVTVSINNNELLQGLQTVSNKIAETAKNVAAAEPALSPIVEIRGADAFRNALEGVRREIAKTADSGKNLINRLTVTTGDVYNFCKNACQKLGSLLGGIGDQFDKMAQRTGVSTSALSEYAYAASMCGADISNVEGALKSMAGALLKAENGSAETQKAFQQLGVDYSALVGLSPEKQFNVLADAIAAVQDPTERAAAAMKIFGSDGQKLLPLFASGSKGLSDLRKEAQQLGVSIDEESSKMGADFVDATTRLNASMRGLGLTVSAVLTPFITQAANALAKLNALVINLTREHPNLTNALVGTAAVLGGVSSGVFLTVKAWSSLSSAFAAAKGVIAAVIPVIKSMNATLLTNPWVALAAVIAAATVALVAWNAAHSKKPQYKSEAQDALASGATEREQDKSDFERLKTLQDISRQHRLSNEQIAEAARLAAQLKNKYGDIGVSVDAVTGKITMATDAQRKLNARMQESRKNELAAAIAEAKANQEDGAIDRKMAREEVSWSELILMKGRNQSWKEYFTDNRVFANDDDARLAILEKDQGFQARLAAAKNKNQAQIASMQAELDAIEESQRAFDEAEAAEDGSDFDENAFQKGVDATADFIDEAAEQEKSALDRRIDAIMKRRDKLIAELRKLADPNGEIDWNNQTQVDALFQNSPTAAALQEQALKVDEAANAQVAHEKLQEEQRKIEDATQKIEQFEKRRADESKSDLQRKVEAIDEETNAYLQQLDVLRSIAEAKGDAAKVQEIDAKKANAQQNAQDRKNSLLEEAQKQAFEKFATPAEKLASASFELQNAIQELQQAQASGDQYAIAEALNKLGAATDKYDSLQDAVGDIGKNIGKSVGGTFNAWQAAAQTTVNWDKQLYTETRTQTNYLRDIANKIGRSAVVFG